MLSSAALVRLHIDDPLDAFPVHGVGGFWGVVSIGFFAKRSFVSDLAKTDVEVHDYGVLYGVSGGCPVTAYSPRPLNSFPATIRCPSLSSLLMCMEHYTRKRLQRCYTFGNSMLIDLFSRKFAGKPSPAGSAGAVPTYVLP